MKFIYTILFLLYASAYVVIGQGLENAMAEEFNGLPYLITKPVDYNKDSSYPTIVFLHGGDRSNTKHHPTKYAAGANLEFPFIVIAPSCTGGCSWSAVDLEGLIEQVAEKVNIDNKRVYLFGYSMGGAGTWTNLKKISHLLAAASPIAPAGGKTNDLCKVKSLPVRVYHGTADYGYKNSQKMVQALKDCGANDVELVSLEGKGHGIWPQIFSDKKFYDWLLSKSR